MVHPLASMRAVQLKDSIFPEVRRWIREYGGVNLSSGAPEEPAPPALKRAACAAIEADLNQYAPMAGLTGLRQAIAGAFTRRYGLSVSPAEHVTVCCGATEATMAALIAVLDPGEEVVLFEPFYESYAPAVTLAGGVPRYVALRPPAWEVDLDELRRAFGPNTKAVIVNSPHNPTGKVFAEHELEAIAALCRQSNALAISDEVYEHVVFDGRRHVPMATLADMFDRTITINSLSKTFAVTGWRVGWTIACAPLTRTIRKVHDYLTIGAPTPLQEAGIAALALPDAFYAELARDYEQRRDLLLGILEEHRFVCSRPQGGYYVMADVSRLCDTDDVAFARRLAREIGVVAVPGSSFYRSASTPPQLRFCFWKRPETLLEAGRRLGALSPRPS
jgi:aminotransferase